MPAFRFTPSLSAFLAAALTCPEVLSGQTGHELRDQIRRWREAHESAILRELADFLAIPNLASDGPNIRRNAERLVQMLQDRGITARLLEVEGSPPAVYGELITPGARRTVVLYAHYDGQPVDSAKWASDPWRPVLRERPLAAGGREIPLPREGERADPEARLYARSASDDKSPAIAMLAALDALRANRVPLSVSLKFFFEGEEEAGSDHLRAMLQRHRDLLRADLWVFADGPVHQSRRPQVVFGVRGVMGGQLTVYGPIRPLHSGHYGNWAPNPNVMLVRLLAGMRDDEGRVAIPGFYRDVAPLSAAERAAFASIPPVERQLLGELRLGRTEGAPASLAERLTLPALNLSGLSGGRTGSAGANVIVPEAQAYLDIRMVPNQTPERVRAVVEEHIRRQGFHIVRSDPDSATRRAHPRLIKLVWGSGYPAVRTALDSPAARALLRSLDALADQPLIRVPTLGGSLPLNDFREVLGTPFVVLPIVNHDNNQHAENENLRIQNLWDGIELFGGLMARLGREWDAVRGPRQTPVP